MKKNCEEIKKSIFEFLGKPIPEEIKLHLERCEGCRKEWVEWMELKRIFLKSFPEKRISLSAESVLLKAKTEETKTRKIPKIWKVAGGFVGLAALFLFAILKRDSEKISFEDEITLSQKVEFYENLEVFENLQIFEEWNEVENEGG